MANDSEDPGEGGGGLFFGVWMLTDNSVNVTLHRKTYVYACPLNGQLGKQKIA